MSDYNYFVPVPDEPVFVEAQDASWADSEDLARYYELKMIENLTPEQIDEFDELLVKHRNKLRLAYDQNKLQDELLKVIRMFAMTMTDWNKIVQLALAMTSTVFSRINNNFDDWSVKRGCTYETEFQLDGSILEIIKFTVDGEILATRLTEFPSNDIIETVMFINRTFDINGNITNTVASTAEKRTTFSGGSIFEEVII